MEEQEQESSTENRAAKYIHMSCIIIRESGKYSVRCIVCQYEYVNIEDLSFIYCLMPISKTITISGVAANKDFHSLSCLKFFLLFLFLWIFLILTPQNSNKKEGNMLFNWKAGKDLRKSFVEDDILIIQCNCEKVFGAYLAGL